MGTILSIVDRFTCEFLQLCFFSSVAPDSVQLETSAADNKACRGDVISINCTAAAVPSVTSYQLFENDIAILDTLGMWTRNVTTEGTFIYKCVANNSLGSGQSANVTVIVNGNQLCFIFSGGLFITVTVCLIIKKILFGVHVDIQYRSEET